LPITSEYGIHATQVNQWKKQATEAILQAFAGEKKTGGAGSSARGGRTAPATGAGNLGAGLAQKKSLICHWKRGER
jgi:transposase-like protein